MRRIRYAASAAATLVGLLFVHPGSAQPSSPALSPETRARLLHAGSNHGLPAWQRELVAAVAGGSTPAEATVLRESATSADGIWRQLPPPSARHLHVAVYDPVRDRMVVFGGYSTQNLVNDVWVLPLAGAPEWSLLRPAGTPPSPRHLMSAVYDPVRDRMIVFGGLDHAIGYRDDVWALSLGASPAWSRIVPAGAGPAARSGHSAVYDPVRDRMIVFGGGNRTGLLDDAWALSLSDPPAWTPLSPAAHGPSARYQPSAVYDPLRDRVVVFGGYDGQQRLDDAWCLSLMGRPRWRPLNPIGPLPTPRVGQAAIYDPAGDRMVVFSGLADGYVNDAWSLSLGGRNVWTRISAAPEPSVRWGHSAIYDPVRARMVVFGGTADGYRLVSEIWGLSLSGPPAWTNLTTPDTPPGPRWGHSAVYDAVHQRMLIFGGYDEQRGLLNEVWMLSLAGRPTWTMLRPSGAPPSPREEPGAIYDPVRNRMIVFGGAGYREAMSDEVWALSLSGEPAWTRVTPAPGAKPEARASHTAIYDAAHDRMVVFGGVGSWYLNDAWALSLSGEPSWTRLGAAAPLPDARFEHSAIYDPVRGRMVIFGGLDMFLGFHNDVWALSLDGEPAWTQITPPGSKPAARSAHRAIYDPVRDRMVVLGGFDFTGGDPGNETWALSLDRPEWTLLQPGGASPGARDMHSAIYEPVGDRMLVFGGNGASNDLWELRWGSPAAVARASARGPRPADVPDLAAPQISPNPTRGFVTISFALDRAGDASVRIYDVAGRTVRTLVSGLLPAGPRSLTWDRHTSVGTLAEPGLYFCEVRAHASASVRRLILLP